MVAAVVSGDRGDNHDMSGTVSLVALGYTKQPNNNVVETILNYIVHLPYPYNSNE